MTAPLNLNWLAMRGAGRLLDLQKTPLVSYTDELYSNPKKTPTGSIAAHTRQYWLNWPAKTVFKTIDVDGGLNKLELEVSSRWKSSTIQSSDDTGAILSVGYAAFPVFMTAMFADGDDCAYATASFACNRQYTATDPATGEDRTYYDIYRSSITCTASSSGLQISTSGTNDPASLDEETYGAYGHPHIENNSFSSYGTGWDAYTIYAKFDGSPILAQDALDDYTIGTTTGGATSFCARHPDDDPHGLSSYVKNMATDDTGLITTAATVPITYGQNLIFSYRHAATDIACGLSQQHDTTCKWFYTPTSCTDCWYADRVATVQITYKKAEVAFDFTPGGISVTSSSTFPIGTWSTHSTVTQELTIPGGFTRQQINASFDVPTVDGYIVAIDDIKLVSVT